MKEEGNGQRIIKKSEGNERERERGRGEGYIVVRMRQREGRGYRKLWSLL